MNSSKTDCSTPGCSNKSQFHDLCGKHYHASLGKICQIPDCDLVATARNLCRKHYRLTRPKPQSHKCITSGCNRQAVRRHMCRHCYELLAHDVPRCLVIGCELPQWSGGLCHDHGERLRVRGRLDVLTHSWKTSTEAFQNLLKTEPLVDTCIEWPFTIDKRGYGKINQIHVHRAVLKHFRGAPPSDKPFACHACGNSSCVNVRHLYWGSPADNSRDMVRHGTRMAGERHPSAKLTICDILEIRSSNSDSRELALKFNVNVRHIVAIQRRTVWRHV